MMIDNRIIIYNQSPPRKFPFFSLKKIINSTFLVLFSFNLNHKNIVPVVSSDRDRQSILLYKLNIAKKDGNKKQNATKAAITIISFIIINKIITIHKYHEINVNEIK